MFILVSVHLLWFIRQDNCFSAVFAWYGLMSAQVLPPLSTQDVMLFKSSDAVCCTCNADFRSSTPPMVVTIISGLTLRCKLVGILRRL